MKSITHGEMLKAFRAKDAAYDGLFVVGVKSTGIFCRVVCPARTPLEANCEFFATARDALFAGFRPCKRCRPMHRVNQPDWAVALLSAVEAAPNVRIRERDLARFKVDPATVRRHFLKEYGMTFQAFTRARRLSHAFGAIQAGASVDAAAGAGGYESLSGFHAAFGQSLGTSPLASLAGDVIRLAWLESPLGPLIAGATDAGVCLLEFTDRRMMEAQMTTLQKRFQLPLLPGEHRHLTQLKRELKEYFAQKRSAFTVPLVHPGTPFQVSVWQALCEIPYGETRSYEDVARAVGSAKAVRAVGTANGLNRIAIVVPCHRVVNKNGDLGGFGGGLRRKQFLLNLEQTAHHG